MAETIKKGDGSVSPDKLKATQKQYDNLKQEMDDTRTDIANLLKTAEETHGIHKAAFKLIHKLQNMSSEKRADFLRAFDSYRHILELDDQPDMLDTAA